jgi:hypothetical protein
MNKTERKIYRREQTWGTAAVRRRWTDLPFDAVLRRWTVRRWDAFLRWEDAVVKNERMKREIEVIRVWRKWQKYPCFFLKTKDKLVFSGKMK